MEVEHWMGKGARAYRAQPNYEFHKGYPGSEAVKDKLHCQKGNSPDHSLRPLSVC